MVMGASPYGHGDLLTMFRFAPPRVFVAAIMQTLDILYASGRTDVSGALLLALRPNEPTNDPQSVHMITSCMCPDDGSMGRVFAQCATKVGAIGVHQMLLMMGLDAMLPTPETPLVLWLHAIIVQRNARGGETTLLDCVLPCTVIQFALEHLDWISPRVLFATTIKRLHEYNRFSYYSLAVVHHVCASGKCDTEMSHALLTVVIDILSTPVSHDWLTVEMCCLFRMRCLRLITECLCGGRYATIAGALCTELDAWESTSRYTFSPQSHNPHVATLARAPIPLLFRALFASCDPQWVAYVLDDLGTLSLNTHSIPQLYLMQYLTTRPISYRHITYIGLYTLASWRTTLRVSNMDPDELDSWVPPWSVVCNAAVPFGDMCATVFRYADVLLRYLPPQCTTNIVGSVLDTIFFVLHQIGKPEEPDWPNSDGDWINVASALLCLVGSHYEAHKLEFVTKVLTMQGTHRLAIDWLQTKFLAPKDTGALSMRHIRGLMTRGGSSSVHNLLCAGSTVALPDLVGVCVETSDMDPSVCRTLAHYVIMAPVEQRTLCLRNSHLVKTTDGDHMIVYGPEEPGGYAQCCTSISRVVKCTWIWFRRVVAGCCCVCLPRRNIDGFIEMDVNDRRRAI